MSEIAHCMKCGDLYDPTGIHRCAPRIDVARYAARAQPNPVVFTDRSLDPAAVSDVRGASRVRAIHKLALELLAELPLCEHPRCLVAAEERVSNADGQFTILCGPHALEALQRDGRTAAPLPYAAKAAELRRYCAELTKKRLEETS